ncbi:MAG TPA: DUF4019 domain-containing protein [Alphaproteobacteria bacterium]|jgi:hypothetical protein|nr:DUF4019 domain-containing protein [Alphaproteobacteria bacterium]HJM49296.1 DUF4019 domain-containing protein [Alphaproteobacteria bacterium]
MKLPKKAVPIVALAAFFLLLAGPPSEAEENAQQVAKQWLALIDRGNYGEGWEQAAPYLQNAVKKDDLVRALKAVRKPLGSVASRRLQSAQPTTSLPGLPDGEYVVIQYHTVFAKKKKAVETITPMRTGDGTWRVAGYYIR